VKREKPGGPSQNPPFASGHSAEREDPLYHRTTADERPSGMTCSNRGTQERVEGEGEKNSAPGPGKDPSGEKSSFPRKRHRTKKKRVAPSGEKDAGWRGKNRKKFQKYTKSFLWGGRTALKKRGKEKVSTVFKGNHQNLNLNAAAIKKKGITKKTQTVRGRRRGVVRPDKTGIWRGAGSNLFYPAVKTSKKRGALFYRRVTRQNERAHDEKKSGGGILWKKSRDEVHLPCFLPQPKGEENLQFDDVMKRPQPSGNSSGTTEKKRRSRDAKGSSKKQKNRDVVMRGGSTSGWSG